MAAPPEARLSRRGSVRTSKNSVMAKFAFWAFSEVAPVFVTAHTIPVVQHGGLISPRLERIGGEKKMMAKTNHWGRWRQQRGR